MLSNQSFWIDEGLTLQRIDHDSIEKVISHLKEERYDRYQPIYFLLLFWWRSIFGNTEFALRSVSALLGSCFVIVIYLLALKLYSKKHSIWSLTIVSFSSFSVYYSQEARPYALVMFLSALQLYFFILSITTKNFSQRLSIWGFWLITLLGIVSSIFLSIFTIALALSDSIVYRNFRRWLKIWSPLVILGLLVLLFFLTSPAVHSFSIGLTNHYNFSLFQNLIFVLYGILVGLTFGPTPEQLRGISTIEVTLSYWPLLVVLFVVVLTILIPLFLNLIQGRTNSKYRETDILLFCLFFASLFLGFLFASITKINWVPRHSSYLIVPLVLILPSAFSNIYQTNFKQHLFFLWTQFAVIALIIFNIYSLNNYYFNLSYRKDDYRSTAQYLLGHHNFYSKSILLEGKPKLLAYYGYPQIIDGRKLNCFELAREVNNLTNNSNTVLLVLNRDFHWVPSSHFSIKGVMNELYNLKSETFFPYFKIYCFEKKNETN